MAAKAAEQETVFFSDLEEFHFTVKAKGNELGDKYFLRQLDGIEHAAWLNYSRDHSKVSPDGNSAVPKEFKGYFEELISMGLHCGVTGEFITKEAITKWNGKLKMELFRKSQEMNGLKEETEPKNS